MLTCNQDKILIKVKHVTNPTEFVACLGEIESFVSFNRFIYRINEWCSKQINAVATKDLTVKQIIEINKIHLSQPVLVKLAVRSPAKSGFQNGGDESWHRGRIYSIDSPCLITVNLIDEGVIKKLSLEDSSHQILFNIPEFYNELEPQAKLCALNKAQPVNGLWSLKSIEYFHELLSEDGLQVEVSNIEECKNMRFDNKRYVLDVFEGGSSVLEKLIQVGYAVNPSLADPMENTASQNRISPLDFVSMGPSGSFNLFDQYMKFDKRSESVSKQMNISNDVIEIQDDDLVDVSPEEDEDGFKPVFVASKSSSSKISSSQPNSLKAAHAYSGLRGGLASSSQPLPHHKSDGLSTNPIILLDSEGDEANHQSQMARQTLFKTSAANNGDFESGSLFKDNAPIRSVGLRDKLMKRFSKDQIARNGLDEVGAAHDIDLDFFRPTEGSESGDKSPVKYLPTGRNFICSDETILTGYKTNTDINPTQLSESIKFANLNRLYPQMYKEMPGPLTSSNDVSEEEYNKEQQIYDIISGDPTSKSLNLKARQLVSLYLRNKSDAKIIVRCILREIISRGVNVKFAVALMNELKFCTQELFIGEIQKLVNENNEPIHDPTFMLRADSNRDNICNLLSTLYEHACVHRENRNLSAFVPYLMDLLSDWARISQEIDKPSYIYVKNLQNLQTFLKNSLSTLKVYDPKILDMIHRNAAKYSLDTTLKNDVRCESMKINIFIASHYVNSRIGIDPESSMTESDTSESLNDPARHSQDDMSERYGRLQQRDRGERFMRSGSGTRIRRPHQGFRFPKTENNFKRKSYF